LQALLQVTEKTTLRAAEFAAAESHPARLRDGRPNVRVVLDTSVLISALISGEGAPARLIDAWVDGRFKLISSEDQLEEFKAMSRRPQLAPFIERADAGRLANQLRAEALIIEKLPRVDPTPSPADHFLLAMAKAGEADYLVSGDRRGVLALAQHGRTQIVTARSMVEALGLE
jgi:putative PIN family toxin of toxin-antitoxin system